MSDSTTVLSSTAKMRLPNPDEAINLGYAIHVADDPALSGKLRQELARERVSLFREIHTEPGTPERAYYECVYGVCISLEAGLARRKMEWMKRLEQAQLERTDRRNALRESARNGQELAVMFRLIKPIGLALGGILAAQFIGIFTPIGNMVHTAANNTATTMGGSGAVTAAINVVASMLMGIVFMVLGRTVSLYLASLRNRQIEVSYHVACYTADMTYERAKKEQLVLFRAQLTDAWEKYSGEAYPDTISYLDVTDGDIAARNRLEQQSQLAYLGEVRMLARIMRRFGRRKPKRHASVGQAAEPEPAE